jgi:hypothetical protein
MGDTCVLLALERGLYILANTSGFATLAGTEAKIALVENVGIFKWASSGGAANGTTIFDGPGGSKWLRILQTNQTTVASSLEDLSNVTISGAAPGDVLQLNGSSEWVNSPLPDGGIVYPGPELMSAVALTPNIIRLTFNKEMQYSTQAGLLIEIPAANTISDIDGTGTDTIDLTVVTPMTEATVITFSYSSTGDLRDLSNNELPNITDFPVLNAITDPGAGPGGGGGLEGNLFS